MKIILSSFISNIQWRFNIVSVRWLIYPNRFPIPPKNDGWINEYSNQKQQLLAIDTPGIGYDDGDRLVDFSPKQHFTPTGKRVKYTAGMK
jgi:hypothetical protein